MCILGFHKNMRPKTYWAVEAYMPFWTKKREAGLWDFKGKDGNLQVDDEEQECGNQILLGPLRNNGESNRPCRFFPVCQTYFILCHGDSSPQVFLSVFLEAGKGSGVGVGMGQKLFLSLLFLKNNHLKIITISKQHVLGWELCFLSKVNKVFSIKG